MPGPSTQDRPHQPRNHHTPQRQANYSLKTAIAMPIAESNVMVNATPHRVPLVARPQSIPGTSGIHQAMSRGLRHQITRSRRWDQLGEAPSAVSLCMLDGKTVSLVSGCSTLDHPYQHSCSQATQTLVSFTPSIKFRGRSGESNLATKSVKLQCNIVNVEASETHYATRCTKTTRHTTANVYPRHSHTLTTAPSLAIISGLG